ncbi:3-deoxy-manno-octulosonate cytidylyltransferase [compost metagenome]
MVLKTVAIVQARMRSTRLPGKVMKNLKGKTVLQHVVDRISQVPEIDQIVIATTSQSIDEQIVDEALNLGIKVYRGSEEDVLSRYYEAALESDADTIIRITSDCPIIDSEVISDIIRCYQNGDFDYVSNTISRTYPRGLDVEVFSFSSLQAAHNEANNNEYREHVTPFIYNHPARFKLYAFKAKNDYSRYRWTLDTIEDWTLIEKIYENLYKKGEIFTWRNVLDLMEAEPYLAEINANVEQKKLTVMKEI